MKVNVRLTASDGTVTECKRSLSGAMAYLRGVIKNRHVGITVITSDGDRIEITPLPRRGADDD